MRPRGFQPGKQTVVPEGNPPDANAGGVVDRVCDGRKHRFEQGLTGSVGRQVWTVRIRIAVHQHDIDALRNVGVRPERYPARCTRVTSLAPRSITILY